MNTGTLARNIEAWAKTAQTSPVKVATFFQGILSKGIVKDQETVEAYLIDQARALGISPDGLKVLCVQANAAKVFEGRGEEALDRLCEVKRGWMDDALTLVPEPNREENGDILFA